MSISIIGNSLVILAILKTPVLRSPSITLLCSLAVSDLLVKLVAQPLYIVFLFQICYFITFSSCGVSLCTITVVSLDRFAALHYHMRYVTMVTKTGVVYTLVAIWLAIFLGFSISLWSIYLLSVCGYLNFVKSTFFELLNVIKYRYTLNNKQFKVQRLLIT